MSIQEIEKDETKCQQVFVAYPTCTDDEINWLDIWKILWRDKKLIGGSFFAFILLATVVTFSLPKVYRAETVLLPPGNNEVAELYVPEIYLADPHEVYREYLKNLQSSGLRYRFFKENHLIELLSKGSSEDVDTYEIFKKGFDEQIHIVSLRKGKRKDTDFTAVTLDGEIIGEISGWLDRYIEFIDSYTVNDLASGIQSQLKVRARSVKRKIETLRLVASQEHADRIAFIKEALVIAKRLNIEKPTGSAFVANDQKKNLEEGTTGIVLDSQDVPLYFRGFKALEGELDQLQKRKDNDSFIIGLRGLQGELASLEKKKIDQSVIHAVRIDQRAIVSKKPIKPKSFLIIGLGGILGLMLGLIGALVKKIGSS